VACMFAGCGVHVRWWLVFLLLGLLLCVAGSTLVGGIAQFVMVSIGVLIALIAVDVWAGGPARYVERSNRAQQRPPGWR
jgi:hypothetical protein